jgi:two-component system, LytTR family, response regulator
MASEAKIRTIIVDDEAPARARIRQLLKDQPDFELVAECSNGRQAVESVERDKPDLMFLDVQMPRLTGLDVCETVAAAGGTMPLVIFVTAYDEYALKAFEVHALDYLLKPFDRERFQAALGHARQQLRRSGTVGTDTRLIALLEELRRRAQTGGRLTYKENGRVVFIHTDTIDWVEADGNYLRIHAGNASHYVRETLTGLEGQLSPDKFMRISRSALVNLDRVKELQPHFYGDYAVILQNGARLNMSRNYRTRLETMLAGKRQG